MDFYAFVMKIAPILLHTENTNNKYNTNSINRFGLFSIPNTLQGDTVSFSGATNTIKITERLHSYIKMGNYTEALKLFKGGRVSFNPNHFRPNEAGKNVSLMGMLLDDFKDLKRLNKHAAEGMLLFSSILYHDDFELENPDAEGDLFVKAVNNHIPVQMLSMMYNSPAFAMIPYNTEKYPNYVDLLRENGYEEISEDVENTLKEFDEINKTNSASYGDEEDDENVNLADYKIELGPYDPKGLDDVGGLEDVKRDIQEYIIKPWDEKYRARLEQNGIKRPTGVLLSGPPGCGKTYIAQAVAAETGYDFYSVSLSNVGDKYAYVTTKKIPAVFNALAEKYRYTGKPSIVFLDEMDSIASSREDASEEWRRADINALLTSINNAAQNGVIVIGATNFYGALDKAAIRSGRLDVVIKISYPDENGRKDIIEKILRDKEVATDIIKRSDELAKLTDGMTPADISSILNIMAARPIYDLREQATMEDFNKAVELHNRKKDMSDIKPVGFKSEVKH
ncbi:ATP-binding protein [bacterium]|nr:ATP-binding protein [bacterium]